MKIITKKSAFLVIVNLLIIGNVLSQEVTTVEFAVKDSQHLKMDIYLPEDVAKPASGYPCIMFVFGGGFMSGKRDDSKTVTELQSLCNEGYVIAAIDYRLGLKGVTKMGITMVKTLENAILMAVEDLYSATSFIYKNAESYSIDKQKIMAMGSSAGAITVLQADYIQKNQLSGYQLLPDSFQYAGIISFSGAIFSRNGKIKYRNDIPAPTFLIHGVEDRLVTYNQIEFFNIGFYGANKIAKRFEKFQHRFFIRRYENMGHEACILLADNIPSINRFYQEYVIQSKILKIDETIHDTSYIRPSYSKMSPAKLYRLNKTTKQ